MKSRLRVRQLQLSIAATVVFLALVFPELTNASPIYGSFNAALTTGSLTGVSFPGTFSYDDALLVGTGQEFIFLVSFDFTLLGTTFSRSDIDQGGQVIFQDGVLQYLTAAIFTDPLTNPPVSVIAFGFGSPHDLIGYRDTNQEFGSGTITLFPAPEAPSVLLMGLGIGSLRILRRRSTHRLSRLV